MDGFCRKLYSLQKHIRMMTMLCMQLNVLCLSGTIFSNFFQWIWSLSETIHDCFCYSSVLLQILRKYNTQQRRFEVNCVFFVSCSILKWFTWLFYATLFNFRLFLFLSESMFLFKETFDSLVHSSIAFTLSIKCILCGCEKKSF